jgi:hypothetical protein
VATKHAMLLDDDNDKRSLTSVTLKVGQIKNVVMKIARQQQMPGPEHNVPNLLKQGAHDNNPIY